MSNKPVFTWVATYTDGTTFEQFSLNGENLFRDIDMNKLQKLSWMSSEDLLPPQSPRTEFTCDFKNGLFYINGSLTRELFGEKLGQDISNVDNVKVKPILFRRVRKIFSASLNTEPETRIVFFLGWEAEIGDEKLKHGLQIYEDGTFSIPPKDSFHAL